MRKIGWVSVILGVAMAMAIGTASGFSERVEASPATQVATMETSFSPETIKLDTTGSSATVNIQTLFELDGSVWAALFNVRYDPNVVSVSSFRCIGFMSGSIFIGPMPYKGNILMGCIKQPGEAVDINSAEVASFIVTRVGQGETTMSFELNDALGTQFYSFHRGKLTPGRTNTLKILQDDKIPTRELARGSQVYLQGQGPRFLYFNGNAEWSLTGGLINVQGSPNFSSETVGLLIGGEVKKIVKNSSGGLDIYVSQISGAYHVVAFSKVPYGTPIRLR